MKELDKKGLLKTDLMTVTGKTVAENIADAENKDEEIIRPIDKPYSETGGIAALFGNLAPEGSVVKRSAVAPEMLVHKGPARVFDSEEEAIAAIWARSKTVMSWLFAMKARKAVPACAKCFLRLLPSWVPA